jgi:hypothetical protein
MIEQLICARPGSRPVNNSRSAPSGTNESAFHDMQRRVLDRAPDRGLGTDRGVDNGAARIDRGLVGLSQLSNLIPGTASNRKLANSVTASRQRR